MDPTRMNEFGVSEEMLAQREKEKMGDKEEDVVPSKEANSIKDTQEETEKTSPNGQVRFRGKPQKEEGEHASE